jgi:hypothetical protein
MGDRLQILVLGVMAILIAALLLAHSLRLMLVVDFETSRLSVLDFVRAFNARARLFLVIDGFLCAVFLLPPISSLLLFCELFPLLALELRLLYRRRLDVDPSAAVRSLRAIKARFAARLALLFLSMLTCVAKILVVNRPTG